LSLYPTTLEGFSISSTYTTKSFPIVEGMSVPFNKSVFALAVKAL
jgi:hypothetical protein